MRDDDTQFVEQLLDAGLARYSSVTPRPGMEQRILAAVEAAQPRRLWLVWSGWLATGAVATVILFSIITLLHHRTPMVAPGRIAANPGATMGREPVAAPPPVAVKNAVHPAAPIHGHEYARVTAAHAAAEPRLAEFPSPQPMTDEEKLLLEFVHRNSAEVLSASAAESTEIPELKIREIEIAPLDVEPNDSQPKQ